MTLNSRILEILRRRSPFEQPMDHADLFEACRRLGLLPEPYEFDTALHWMCESGQLEVTWSRNGPGKMQAAYTATAKRATQAETLIGDTHD